MFGLNKYVIYAIIAAVSILFLTGTYYTWKNSIRQQALLEFNAKQLEQVVEEQKKYAEAMKKIAESQDQIISELNGKNKILQEKLESLETYLNGDEAIRDSRPSSEVLKKTIRELSK